jgi:PAS domain-containing protein/DNA-binding CsgD family transcriptional regulator
VESAIERAVEHIYDAILDDDAFDSLTGRLASLFSAGAGCFSVIDGKTGALRLAAPYNVPQQALADYAAYYHQFDPWVAASLTVPPNRAMRWENHMSPGRFKKLQFYTDYVEPHLGDMTCGLAARLQLGEDTGFLGLCRTDRLGPFSDGADQVIDVLIKPLRRMLTVRRRLEAAEGRISDLEHVLDLATYGVVRCDGDARILYANRTALDMLRQQDGLQGMWGEKVGAIDHNAGVFLEHLIGRAARGSPPSSGAVQIARSDGRPPYKLVVVPFRRPGGLYNTCLLLIDDPARRDPDLINHLRDLYNFSTIEAELAIALVSGLTPEEYAEARQFKMATIRTRIHNLLDKAGVRRQLDLIALLGRKSRTAPTSAAG